jgi:hypothetical protein
MFKKPKQIEINKTEDSNNGIMLKNNLIIERPLDGMTASYNIKTMEYPIFNINSCKKSKVLLGMLPEINCFTFLKYYHFIILFYYL